VCVRACVLVHITFKIFLYLILQAKTHQQMKKILALMTLVIAFIKLNVSELKINENLPTLITKLFNISKYVLY